MASASELAPDIPSIGLRLEASHHVYNHLHNEAILLRVSLDVSLQMFAVHIFTGFYARLGVRVLWMTESVSPFDTARADMKRSNPLMHSLAKCMHVVSR